MDGRHQQSLIAAAVFFLLSFAPVSPAVTTHFVEDFTTTDYRHGAYTNAWWDTGTGELKLRSFELSVAGSYDTPG